MNENKSIFVPFPRPGSAEYSLLLETNPQKRKKILKRWKRMNKFFTIPIYRLGILPLIGGHKIFLLLFTKGRKSGKIRITPVEYRSKDGIIHVVAGRGKKAHWYQNLLANPKDIMIKLGFKKHKATFQVLETVEEKNELLRWYVGEYPKAAKMLFGWDPKEDNPATADFTTFSMMIEIVKFYI
ncbi:nitroreductase family deazaflavin-dependent oxidoreductase [Candidatus Heimdallarchaeota archaeon]|nr:MAG: nitroreductase family deazaflavin-dependent oxidoreductase [Candidatus Heimdallarchaeota archaeon]